VDGWGSLEVSPLLAHETAKTVAAPRNSLRGRTAQPVHQDPWHQRRLPAIEEAIFAGVPVNVTLLFSREQYVAAAEAYLARHRTAYCRRAQSPGRLRGLDVHQPLGCRGGGQGSGDMSNRLGIAVAGRIYKAYLDQLSNPRCQRAYNHGARPQRLLWASTGTKDPKASDILYIKALASPFTVNTMPEATLKPSPITGNLLRPWHRTVAIASRSWPSS